MHHFAYRDGVLHAEEVSLSALADAVGTPFYCYSTATLTRHYRAFAGAVPQGALIAYSVKANGNLSVLKTLARLGAGADVVSGGELKKALAAGIAPSRIVFSGVGKSERDMRAALVAGIHQFNVESEPELERLNALATALGMRAPVAIRVNPDVDAKTHAKISTGGAETKFGIAWRRVPQVYARAAAMAGIAIVGIDCHIGSQITDLAPFEAAFTRIVAMAASLREAGHPIARIDFGGGLGVPYRQDNAPPPDPDAYGAMVTRLTRGLDVEHIFEPGRLIVANAGVLVTRVEYIKEGEERRFAVLDAGMNDLLRPAMYDAWHDLLPVRGPREASARYDVVGPVCETSDLFARDRALPELEQGELIAISTAGAYGAVMASAYNARPPAGEVLVNGRDWALVRPREDEDELVRHERMADWLAD